MSAVEPALLASARARARADADAQRLAASQRLLALVDARLLGAERTGEPERVLALRHRARSRLAAAGLPGPRDEGWRHSAPSELTRLQLRLPGRARAPTARVAPSPLSRPSPWLVELRLADGRLVERVGALPEGLTVCSLGEALRRGEPEALQGLESAAGAAGGPLGALNAALFDDGAYVRVREGTSFDLPIRLVLARGAPDAAVFPRALIVAGARSRVTVVETHVSGAAHASLSCPVTELLLGPGSEVAHCKVQREGEHAFHAGAVHAVLRARARLRAHVALLGGRWVREDVTARLDEEGAACALDGLYVCGGRQRVDLHTFVDHAVPGCSSEERSWGIAGGEATGTFTGRVRVRPDAQKSQTAQEHHGLLLSGRAQVNAQPQLEIFADDVQATHGAAVGQLDPDALFYLRARGIGADQARALLVSAFAASALDRLPVPFLREELDALVRNRLAAGGGW